MKRKALFWSRAFALLALGCFLVLQSLYHEPLLTRFIAVQDTSKVRTNTANTVSIPTSEALKSPSSSTAPHPTQPGGQIIVPESTNSPQDSLSYQDCSTKPWDNEMTKKANVIVQEIMNGSNQSDSYCPAINSHRYLHLSQPKSKPRWFFALDLFQSIQILEQLLSSIVQATNFLGPENCVVSIVEGRSTDGTYETLNSLQKELQSLGVQYYLQCVDIDPTSPDGDRILALAQLRNYALLPLIANPKEYDPDTRIIFINDVALCTEDILELLHQGVVLDADMTCAFDWIGGCFYDVWISRTMVGDIFFEIPQSSSWEFAGNLFWNHEASRKSYSKGHPFQVFSCWNGAVAMVGKPFLEGKIKFRSSVEGECRLGEPVHLAKDLWNLGYGKIAVVPSVNVAYTLEGSAQTKKDHGTVSSWVEKEEEDAHKIEWIKRPPGQIKCFVDWSHPSWEPWDQGLQRPSVLEIA